MLFWASWPLSLTSCAPDGSRDKNINAQKVITKIRGVDGKSPEINAKHDYNI
jgi:hypothetical protein